MTLGNCLLKVNLSGLPNDMRFVAKTPEERLDRMPEALSSRVSHQKELVGALAKWAADALQDVDLRAIGHRVVHGGRDFDGPVLANKKILEHLRFIQPCAIAPARQPGWRKGDFQDLARNPPDTFIRHSFSSNPASSSAALCNTQTSI